MSPSRPRFAASYDAVAASVVAARSAVSAFAARSGATMEDLERLRLAVSEAVTNAVVHAYPPDTPGLIHVTAALAGRELSVIVADDGCGLGGARETPGLGLGLRLMDHSCASLAVTARPSGGTQLEMRFLLSSTTAEREHAGDAARHRVASLNPLRLAAFFEGRAAEGGT
jgi:anti-sigma regulatory factor (Ser/Thr protein kinase)